MGRVEYIEDFACWICLVQFHWLKVPCAVDEMGKKKIC